MSMKYLMCLIFTALIGYSDVDGRVVTIPDAKVNEHIRGTFAKCASETENLTEVFNLLGEGKYRDDDDFKQLVFCVHKANGLVYGDGSLNPEAHGLIINDEEFVQAIRNCDKIGATVEETNWMSFKCFQDTTPVYLQL